MLRVFNKSNMLITVGGIGIMPKKSHIYQEATQALLHETSLLEKNDILRVTVLEDNIDYVEVEEKPTKTSKKKTKLAE